MKELFYEGGIEFMGTQTLLFIITIAWIVYHFVKGYISKKENLEKVLRKIEYGKSIGLFTMIVGFLGQMIGFIAMFDAIEQVDTVMPKLVYGGIKATLICPIYGIIIYLITLILWFATSTIIENRVSEK